MRQSLSYFRPPSVSNHLTTDNDWFTEGFDTPDLIEAKALLDELS